MMILINRAKLLLIVKKLGKNCKDPEFYQKVYNAIMSAPIENATTIYRTIADGNGAQCSKCLSIYTKSSAAFGFRYCPSCSKKIIWE